MPQLSELAQAYFAAFPQPHPTTGRPLSVTVGEWPTMLELANHAKFGGHAEPEEIEGFHKEFSELKMEPEDFKHVLDQLAPLSFVYHGRPPTMKEVSRHRDSKPGEMRSYYADLPDRHYPQVSAGDMVKALESARFYSNHHFARDPYPSEAMHFHHMGWKGQQIDQHYARMKDDVRDKGGGSEPGGSGSAPSRQFSYGYEVAGPEPSKPQQPTPTWHGGVSAGGEAGSTGAVSKDGS